jgi:membrane protease subunit HflC
MTPRSLISLVAAFFLVLLAMDSFFIVKETQRAVLKRFAEIVEQDIQPGIYFKVPFVDKVVKMDARILVHDVPSQPFLTSEKKLLEVDSFVIWRISDVQKYVTAVGSSAGASANQIQFFAQQLLDPRIKEGLRNEFAERTVQEVVSGEREKVMDSVATRVNEKTQDDLGIEVIDIRVKQVDWPDEVRSRVFDRMRAERARDAAEHRANGREEAEKIRAEADKQRTVLLAEAYRDSEEIRGEGDARATDIYAKAFTKNPEFFRFYRSLRAYRESFDQPEDVLVLEPNSEFFRYLKDSGVQP